MNLTYTEICEHLSNLHHPQLKANYRVISMSLKHPSSDEKQESRSEKDNNKKKKKKDEHTLTTSILIVFSKLNMPLHFNYD